MIYLSLFFITFIFSIASLAHDFPARKAFFAICVAIFLVVSLRYASVDYFGYLRIYEGVEDLSKLGFFIYNLNPSTPVETGFALFVFIEKLIFGHYFIFVGLFSLFSLLIKFSAFKKISPYFIVSLLIYLSDEYFWKDLGQIRNAMASGILLWAFYYAYSRKPVIFVGLVLSAMMFHSVALVALPFYFVWWLRKRTFLILSIILSLFVVVKFGGLGNLLVDIGYFFDLDDEARILKYSKSQYAEGVNPFGGTFILQMMVCVLVIIFHTKLVVKWDVNKFLIPVYIYGSCLFFVFIDYGIISGRIREMITVPVACVILPSFILLFRGYSKYIPAFLISGYCASFFYMIIQDRPPYQSILEFWI